MMVYCEQCKEVAAAFVVAEIAPLRRAVVAARCHDEIEYKRLNLRDYTNNWKRKDRLLTMFRGKT